VLIAAIGSFSIANNIIDVRLMVAVGILGYVLRKLNFSLASLLVGLVLGPLIEKYFMQSMFISRGDPMYLFSSPIAIGVWALVALVLIGGMFTPLLRRRRRGAVRSPTDDRTSDDERDMAKDAHG
jgi:putative tricarboxylic transport membrane protein